MLKIIINDSYMFKIVTIVQGTGIFDAVNIEGSIFEREVSF
jgi:hypothetical protein